MIEEKDWRWHGLPAHFIDGKDCWFHLCTQVGNVLVSTVGDYRPRYLSTKDEPCDPQEIGYNRLYQTFVFRLIDPIIQCICGCGMPRIANYSEIDRMPAKSGQEAAENHLAMCRKWADEPKTPQ